MFRLSLLVISLFSVVSCSGAKESKLSANIQAPTTESKSEHSEPEQIESLDRTITKDTTQIDSATNGNLKLNGVDTELEALNSENKDQKLRENTPAHVKHTLKKDVSSTVNPRSQLSQSKQTANKLDDDNKRKNIAKKPQIALIVDDLGYNVAKVEHLLQLKQPITLALIPDTPHAKKIAKTIEKEGYELMLHIPMETVDARSWEQGLTDSMERKQFDEALAKMLRSFPTAKGINNHGGSLLTQKRDKMDWVMETLVNEQLYFVDSRTIASSIAAEAANEAGLDLLSRDVFLDNERSYDSIARELQKLQKIALKRGSAIGIAHPYHETLAVLEDMMPKMASEGIEFVFISEIASIHNQTIKRNLH